MIRPAWLGAAALGIAAVLVTFFPGSFAGAPAASLGPGQSFKRGATLVEFFEFPKSTGDGATKSYAEDAYPHPLQALSLFDFDRLRRAGFDHMRVPLDVGPLMAGDAQQQQEILDNLVAVVSAINAHGLAVLVTLFPPSLHHELPRNWLDALDGPKFHAYVQTAERVAVVLSAVHSGAVALEPMNEPQTKCHVWFGTDWTEFQDAMIDDLRRAAPDLPLLLTGGCWSDIEGVTRLDTPLLRDPRNLVSVHFYRPFLFTHQSSWWTEPDLAGTIGVPYPASAGSLGETLALSHARFRTVELPAGADRIAGEQKADNEIRQYFAEDQGPARLTDWMNKLADWQAREHINSDQIVFTEFGAIKELADGVEIGRDSRARWLHDAAAAIAGHGWGWTAYVLRDDPFGLYVNESDPFPDPRLLRALGLDVPQDELKSN
ncbi:MAG TPA: cellulase family glycosylhydrolase [Xanthobacteraceae bacterium]|nr:cellulase family glycosylhydrolase [Xanthobacteraceae bacterium]